MQQATYIPVIGSRYVLPKGRRQNCCAVLAAGHRGAVICADASCSAIKTTAVNFFKIPPHRIKGALARQEPRTLRRGVRPSGRLALPNALQPSHHAFARLSCCSYRAATSSLHTQSISRARVCGHRLLAVGFAKRSHPASSHPCFTRGGIACLRSRSRRHSAGHRAVRCWLRQTLTVPATSSVPLKTFEHSQFRCRRYSKPN